MTKTLMFVFAIILFFSRFLTTKEVDINFRQLTCKFDEDCEDQASEIVEILLILHERLLICEKAICRAISI
jgi:hypothetical protein